MELKVVISENQALHNAVEMKRQEVMNVALSIVEQKEYLESLSQIAKQLAKVGQARLGKFDKFTVFAASVGNHFVMECLAETI